MILNTFLGQQRSDRKLRLFAVACVHQIKHLLNSHQTIEIAELFADGLASRHDLRKAHGATFSSYRFAEQCKEEEWSIDTRIYSPSDAAYAAFIVNSSDTLDAAISAAEYSAHALAFDAGFIGCVETYEDARNSQMQIVEDIFHLHRSMLSTSPSVRAIACSIYEDKHWADMPILADALEDAECLDNQILDHLRSNQAHYRGCWALDLILGKS